MKSTFVCAATALALAAMAACAPASRPPEATASPAPPTPTATGAQITPPQVTDPSAGMLLNWQQGIPDTGCERMVVTTDYVLSVGPCNQAATRSQTIQQEDSILLLRWAAANLAPFQALQTDGVGLVFRGSGSGTDPAWQHAVATWAEFTFAQETTGHVCAACQTALSWTLKSMPGGNANECRNLIVLNFGVAYAQVGPCDGSHWTLFKRGLVPQADWDEFSGWLTTYQAHDAGGNTFSGTGSSADLPDITAWAARVHEAVSAGSAN